MGVKYRNKSGKLIDFGGNRELLQTNSINALIFNNYLTNNQSDLYDLNFRQTSNRTPEAKNRFQLIERNLFTYGNIAKTTGEGVQENIMRFSNNGLY